MSGSSYVVSRHPPPGRTYDPIPTTIGGASEDLTELEGRVTSLEEGWEDVDLSELEADIASLETADTSLDGRLDTAESTLTSHGSTLSSHGSDLTSLDGRLDATEASTLACTQNLTTHDFAFGVNAGAESYVDIDAPVGTNMLVSVHLTLHAVKTGNGGIRTFDGTFGAYRDHDGNLRCQETFLYTTSYWGDSPITELDVFIGGIGNTLRITFTANESNNVYVVARAQLATYPIPITLNDYTP